MELRQLRYFIAVADARSISAAGRKLHVVQSAISHQIANLESELGAELVVRGKAGVTLTPAGQFLYRHARAIVKQVETASQGVSRVDKEIRGKVAVGIPNSTAAILALPLLKAVRAELPYVELTIVEGLSGLLAEQLSSGRLDFSILFETEPLRGFQNKPLVAERLHFVSADPAMLRATRGLGISLRLVLQRPLILPPQPNGIRLLLEREALRSGLKTNVVADVTGVETMLAAVKDGVADSVMMAANAKRVQSGSELLVIPVRTPVIERTAGLFEPAQFALPAAASCVRDIVLKLVDQLVAEDGWPGARPLERT